MYLDEYGRYRASNYQKPRVRSRSFEEWQQYFNPTSAAPVSATSATPVSAVVTDGTNTDAGGGDVADNQAGRDTLPDYETAGEWAAAMGRTPTGVVGDAILGRGLFAQEDPSYVTVGERRSGLGSKEMAESLEANAASPEAQAEIQAANEAAAAETNAGLEGGPQIDIGIDRAEGGPVFNSPEQVPGPVVGPGGPKDDQVDANLSNGEFVSTAEATQTFGEDFLTNLNDIARSPQAQGLMSNPAFEQAKQEFVTKINSLMAPPQGMAPAPGMPAPPPGEAPLETPMGAQPGFAEGGRVSQGEYAAAKAELDRAIRGRDAAKLNKSMGTSLMGQNANYDAQVAAAQARLRQLQNDSRDFAEGGMIESDPLRFLKDIEAARGAGTAGGMSKTPGTEFELVGKPYKTPGTGFTMIDEVGYGDGFTMTEERTSKPQRPPKPEPKGKSLMAPAEDFFDWLMDKYNKMRNVKQPNPDIKLLEDYASKAKDITPREKAGVDSVPSKVGLGLLSRAIPGAGTFAAAMSPTALNENEDAELARLTENFNPKESRTKDDKASAPVTNDGKEHMNENMKKEAESLFKKPKKQEAKKKETSKEENKVSPNASLGDALAFYRQKGADKFTWEGETYVRSENSPTGFVLT